MSVFASKYGIELVNPAGLLLADLTGRASKRSLSMSRNEAEEINWTIDLDEFENFCRKSKLDPLQILVPCSTEVRIKRLGTYLAGGQMVYFSTNINAREKTIEVKATGFLNLFKDRFTEELRYYDDTEATTIASNLITESQNLPNGDFGIVIGALVNVGHHNREYDRTNIKNALQDLTTSQVNPFDMEFTYDKVFNTYAQIGNKRPDIIFEYPGNIISLGVPNDGTGIANEITAIGQGFGSESQAVAVEPDLGSQATYRLRQKLVSSNGTDDSDLGLTDVAKRELASWAFPFEVPTITISGNIAPFITDYGIGDRVLVRVRGYDTLAHINAFYRIERIELDVDDEDNETVKLYLSV